MGAGGAAGLLGDLAKETSEELLHEMPGQEADEVRELLEFDPATAGGMMNTDFAFVGEASTREEVLEWMRGQELNIDQLDTIVLLDSSGQFSGTVPLARLRRAVGGVHGGGCPRTALNCPAERWCPAGQCSTPVLGHRPRCAAPSGGGRSAHD